MRMKIKVIFYNLFGFDKVILSAKQQLKDLGRMDILAVDNPDENENYVEQGNVIKAVEVESNLDVADDDTLMGNTCLEGIKPKKLIF